MQPKPKKWKVQEDRWNEIKQLLLSNGGKEDLTVSEASGEVWRVRINKAVFTQYSNGTLLGNPTSDEYALAVRDRISALVGTGYEETERDFLIGLDETGKGEAIGHSVLAGVVYPAALKKVVEDLLGVADTKKKHETDYWDQLYLEIDSLKSKGLMFATQRIPPWHIDRYNINKIMDTVYQRIISDLLRLVPAEKCSIVLDNYGIGKNLELFLKSLEKRDTSIRVESKADDRYVEAKLASVVAKREREKMIQNINRKFGYPDCPIGSGNAGDLQTIKWLDRWKKTGEPWPWFVKQSFANIRRIDKRTGPAKKVDPPIRHELISPESQDFFREGKLSATSLSILCPSCGNSAKSAKVTPNTSGSIEGRCIGCNTIIDNLNTTLLYYNGYLIPDSSVIISGLISKDLEKGKFFENFTFLLHPAVSRECDNKGGKAELGKIADDASIGKIGLENLDENIDESKTNDELIVEAAKKHNAIVLTRDQGMYAKASGMGVFVLTK